MRYLSLDLEATGLEPHDLIIEIAFIPVDAQTHSLRQDLAQRHLVSCPSLAQLRSQLSDWVIEHNSKLIEQAHQQGLPLPELQQSMRAYLSSAPVREFFKDEKIVLMGKSMNAIDLPFMHRDLGEAFMREFFSHRILDVSSWVYGLIDAGILPPDCESGSELSRHLGQGEVAHTALEDACHTAEIYFLLQKKLRQLLSP